MSEMVVEDKSYGIDEVFSLIGMDILTQNHVTKEGRREHILVDNFIVRPMSLRYMTFYQKGCTCVSCGKRGTHFKLCGEKGSNVRHFNLYADDGTLLTKDHIVPKSKGGADTVSNMQTMCEHCNSRKGNKVNT